MLRIQQLHVQIDEQPILRDIDFDVEPGSVHAIMGPNGSGKSSLAYTLMGHPYYKVVQGDIVFAGKSIAQHAPDERARAGIFLAFQQPPEIPGVDLLTFLKEAHYAVMDFTTSVDEFHTLLAQYMKQLRMNPALAYRKLNDGFSGGEKKQLEMLQLLLLRPKLAILDEIDSGLDIDALKNIASGLQYVRQQNPSMSVILITHYQRILQYVTLDVVHILCGGRLVRSGGLALVDELERRGYDAYK